MTSAVTLGLLSISLVLAFQLPRTTHTRIISTKLLPSTLQTQVNNAFHLRSGRPFASSRHSLPNRSIGKCRNCWFKAYVRGDVLRRRQVAELLTLHVLLLSSLSIASLLQPPLALRINLSPMQLHLRKPPNSPTTRMQDGT